MSTIQKYFTNDSIMYDKHMPTQHTVKTSMKNFHNTANTLPIEKLSALQQ